MGNNMSSTSRRQKRSSSPRKIKQKKSLNRFGFSSKKRAAKHQPVISNASAKRTRFGFGGSSSRKRAAMQQQQLATSSKPRNRFGFGSKKNRAACQQQAATSSTPAALRNIKAKIAPNSPPVTNSKKRGSRSSDASSLTRKFGQMAWGKAKSSGVGPFKKHRQQAPPPAKRGFFSKLGGSNKRRY